MKVVNFGLRTQKPLLKNIGVKVVNQACKTKSQTALSKAVSFWKNWLNDPITRKKVEQNLDR